MIGGRSRLLQGDRIAEGLPDPNILPCHDPLAHPVLRFVRCRPLDASSSADLS